MDKNNDFIRDWLEGKVSPEELKSRKEKGDTVVHEFDELITRSSRLKVPENLTREEAWQKLTTRLDQNPKQDARVVKLNRWIPLSIAASVTLIAIVFFVFSKVTVSTQMAETKVHVLPDGSEITLNADSEIAYSRFAWTAERKVTLNGEAFFKVTKGEKFTVETKNGTVAVLGTSFNVNARHSGFEVSCFTGKVKVGSSGKDVVLTKGLFTKLRPGGLTDAEAFDTEQATWRSGDFFFESTPLGIVIGELERQFNIEIIFKGDASRLYTGYFSRKDLDEALNMVFTPMAFSYQRSDSNKIIVK